MRQAIGIIDSGLGGLTVVKEVMKQLPNELIYYVGDTARCPYGPRSVEEVKQFTWEMTRFLLEKNIKMLVIACNTATAVILDELRDELKIPVFGVIYPGARAAFRYTKNQKIAVLGTLGTIKSGAYETALRSINKQVEIIPLACPKFVPLVESGQYNSPIAKKLVAETLEPILHAGMDTVILGCTHYPLLQNVIQNVVGNKINIINSGAEAAREISTILYFHDIFTTEQSKPHHQFFTTGSSIIFNDIASDWLERIDLSVETIHLGS